MIRLIVLPFLLLVFTSFGQRLDADGNAYQPADTSTFVIHSTFIYGDCHHPFVTIEGKYSDFHVQFFNRWGQCLGEAYTPDFEFQASLNQPELRLPEFEMIYVIMHYKDAKGVSREHIFNAHYFPYCECG